MADRGVAGVDPAPDSNVPACLWSSPNELNSFGPAVRAVAPLIRSLPHLITITSSQRPSQPTASSDAPNFVRQEGIECDLGCQPIGGFSSS